MDFRKKTTLYVVLLCLLPAISWGQYRYKKFTYFGIEAGLKGGINKMSDSGYELYQKNGFQNGIQGIFLEQELSRYTSISTGLYFTKSSFNFQFHRDNGINTYAPMRSMLVPFRFIVNIPLFYGIPEIRLAPSLGISTAFNLSDNQLLIRGRIAPDLSDTYVGMIRYDLKSVYFLGEGGLNLDMMFAKGLIISVGGNYAQGIANVSRLDLEYRIGREINQGALASKGSYYSIHLSAKYPISRWWRSKK
jgi:hypothetical protein